MALSRVIFHVGTGKTGSSSIQILLSQAKEKLEAQGVAYLGRLLETYRKEQSLAIEPWQNNGGSSAWIKAMKIDNRSFLARLRQQLSLLEERGIHTAVISNEGLTHLAGMMEPVIVSLASEGREVEIIAAVRRHYEWVFSAYLQWGVRHKVLPGRVLGFADWLAARPPRFGQDLATWSRCQGVSKFHIINYSAVDDIVSEFLARLKIELPGSSSGAMLRENQAVSQLEAIIHTTYNDHKDSAVHPSEVGGLFERLERLGHMFRVEACAEWSNIKDVELEMLVKVCQDDLGLTNKLLQKYGQPEFSSVQELCPVVPNSVKRHELLPQLRQSELVAALLSIVVDLDRQLADHERYIKELRKELGG